MTANGTERRALAYRAAGAAVSAGAYYLAFPGVGLWFLGVLCWVPLYVASAGLSVKRALWLGWLAGFLANLLGFLWLPRGMVGLASSSWPAAYAAYLLLASYQAGAMALVLGGSAWLAKGVPRPVAWTMLWAAAEAWYPHIVPVHGAAVFHDLPALLQPAAIGGSPLVVLLSGFINVAVGEAVLHVRQRRSMLRWLGAGILLLVAWLAYGAARLWGDATPSSGRRVLLVQGSIPPLEKRARPSAVIRDHALLTRRGLRQNDVDLVIWGETVFFDPIAEEELARTFARATLGINVPVVTGAAIQVAQKKATNSVVWSAPDGTVCPTCVYDKQRLVPIAEDFESLSQLGLQRSFRVRDASSRVGTTTSSSRRTAPASQRSFATSRCSQRVCVA